MAHGDIIAMTWTGNPQSPAPATLTVTDTWGTAIAAQTLVLQQYRDNLATVGDLLIEAKKTIATMNYLVNTYNSAVLSISAQSGQRNAMLAMVAASNIQTNNFFKEVNGETPSMPPVRKQLTTSVVDGVKMQEVSQAEGAVLLQINNMIQYFQSFATSALDPLTSVLTNFSDRLKTAIQTNPPSNAQDKATKLSNLAGNPDNGNVG